MKRGLNNLAYLFKCAFKEYAVDDTWVLGAALSYYTIFSLAPILIIVIAVAGMIFGKDAVQGQIYHQISQVIGPNAAIQVQDMVKSAYAPGTSKVATVIATVLLIFGATTVFYQLQSALNKIWEVKPNPKKGFIMYLRSRVLSFGLIIAIGFLLLVSLVINALLVGFSNYLTSFLPGYSVYLFQGIDLVLSVVVITLLFAMIYRFLPDAIVRWRDVWAGSLFTAFLFTLGRYAIAFYLGKSNIGTTYGAAGSVVVILVWVSYSAQILFFGAEFTQVFAQRFGTPILPAPYAKRVKLVPVEQASDESASEFEKKVEGVQEVGQAEEDKPLNPGEMKFTELSAKEDSVHSENYYQQQKEKTKEDTKEKVEEKVREQMKKP